MSTDPTHIQGASSESQINRKQARSVLFTGILIGIGIAGFLDETLFHQLLQWHAFYWATDQHGRILSDGLFHLVNEYVCNGAVTQGNNMLANCPQDIPYEIVWESLGLIILVIGIILWRRNTRVLQTSFVHQEPAER